MSAADSCGRAVSEESISLSQRDGPQVLLGLEMLQKVCAQVEGDNDGVVTDKGGVGENLLASAFGLTDLFDQSLIEVVWREEMA